MSVLPPFTDDGLLPPADYTFTLDELRGLSWSMVLSRHEKIRIGMVVGG
jgi:hypothetical protein